MKLTIKFIILSDNWILQEVLEGHNDMVRVSARRRYHEADEEDFFQEWCTKSYLDKLCLSRYGKKAHELRTWKD